MLAISSAFKRHLAQETTTLCSILKVTLRDGTILGFADLDRDITYDGLTYSASHGYMRKDVASAADLSVDNTEIDGILNSPFVNEADLHSGLWDHAAIELRLINWADVFVHHAITAITRVATTATATVSSTAALLAGDTVVIAGVDQAAYNGSKTIGVVSNATHFTFTVAGSPTTPATGSMYYQTSMGTMALRIGHLGEVTVERGKFTAEIRGVMQAYSRTIGELTSPGCRANLGDSRCKVDLMPFTVTGTLTGVSPDGLTLYDTARTEPGPSGGVDIVNVTNSNPGHVFLTTGGGASFTEGQPVTLSGIVGPALLNLPTVIRNLSGDEFDLGVDTSNTAVYPTYVSGGTVTPSGGDSGYFDYGVITMDDGASAGFSQDVLAYVPGQWQLQLPLAYGAAPGDAYTMVAGCDKSLTTCRDRFSNVKNMRAEPWLPGADKIVQVGKQ